jgi:phosphoserine phosphatase
MHKVIYAGAARLIEEAIKRGEKVIFATSSFYTIIQPLERFFGIEGSLASMLEFRDGRTTGRLTGNSLFGAKKKTAIETWLGENNIQDSEVRCYSDSYTDLPMLELSGSPAAVNPDRFLLREAKKRGWEIMRFTEMLGASPQTSFPEQLYSDKMRKSI